MGGPKENVKYAWNKWEVKGLAGRYPNQHPNTHYEQPRELWATVMNDTDRDHLVSNLSGALGGVSSKTVKENILLHLYRIHPDYGTRVGKMIGVDVPLERLNEGKKDCKKVCPVVGKLCKDANNLEEVCSQNTLLKNEVCKLGQSNKCLMARLVALEKRMSLKEEGVQVLEEEEEEE